MSISLFMRIDGNFRGISSRINKPVTSNTGPRIFIALILKKVVHIIQNRAWRNMDTPGMEIKPAMIALAMST